MIQILVSRTNSTFLLQYFFSKLLKSWQDNKLQMMSDKMDDERLEMNEKMMKMESKAAEVESNLRQQVRLIQFYSSLFILHAIVQSNV